MENDNDAVTSAMEIKAVGKELAYRTTLHDGKAIQSATAAGVYEANLAEAILRHRAKGTPVTLTKDIARGECKDDLINKLASEFLFKANSDIMKSLARQLACSGWVTSDGW